MPLVKGLPICMNEYKGHNVDLMIDIVTNCNGYVWWNEVSVEEVQHLLPTNIMAVEKNNGVSFIRKDN